METRRTALADTCTVVNAGDRSALSEGLFGGFSYTPSVSTDPGFNPGAATQDTYFFAGDPEDAPELSTLGFGNERRSRICFRRDIETNP